jgi:hypothetical protein
MIRSSRRRLLPLALTCAVLAGVVAWSLRSRPVACRTPAECLDAYRDAWRAGDAGRYRRCLGEPLRSEVRHDYPADDALAAALRREARGVKGWVAVGPPAEQGGRAVVDVDEVRETGQRRLRFSLEQSSDGWLVVRVETGTEQPPAVRYGTPVGEEGPGR